MGDTGFELLPDSLGNSNTSSLAVPVAVPQAAELRQLAAKWPSLSQSVRDQILRLAGIPLDELSPD